VIRYVDEFYNRMVAEKRIDVFVEKKEKKASRNGKDLQMIDLNSIRNKDVREIGAEWLSNRKQKIELCQVNSDRNTDYYLKIESHSKELKERSMNEQFRARFEAGLQQIADSLTRREE